MKEGDWICYPSLNAQNLRKIPFSAISNDQSTIAAKQRPRDPTCAGFPTSMLSGG